MVERRSVRFDCGHLVCCNSCADSLQNRRLPCPVCRVAIGRKVFEELPPVPGRQPTFESEEIALQRLLYTLMANDEAAKEEAAFAVCQRAMNDNAQAFVNAGVIPPLVALLAEGAKGGAKGREAAAVTLGILGADATPQVLDAGGAGALLAICSLRYGAEASLVELAALALYSLVENDAAATAAAIRSLATGAGTGLVAGLETLIAVLRADASSTGAKTAAAGTLAELAALDEATRESVAGSVLPVADQLRALRRSCGDAELAEMVGALLETASPRPAIPTTSLRTEPQVTASARQRKKCAVM